jgi:bacterioferritin-associated ferredoxin
MTSKQNQLYWREWAAVRRIDKTADRHALHAEALGQDKSHTEFTNADFDRVLGVFRAITQPANLNGQVRQQQQPRHRQEHRLAEIQSCLGLYVDDVAGYVARVVADKFGVPVAGARTLEDLSDQPRWRRNGDGELIELPSELKQVLMTLWARVNGLRNQAGHSLHEMRTRAGVPCDCAKICRKAAQVVVTAGPARPAPFPYQLDPTPRMYVPQRSEVGPSDNPF